MGLGSGKDVFEELDVEGFIGCFTAAEVFEDEVPVPMVSSLTKWFNDTVVPKTPTSMPKKTAPKVGSGLAIEKESGVTMTSATNLEMENDMKAMSLDSGEITTLALSIETGQVHTEYDVIEVAYGSDPCLTEVARQRRKAGLESLSKLVASKDGRGISVHFASLIRDLNADGRSKEVSVITSWLMEAQQVFGDDSTAFVGYVKEYLRRYKGRAFPVKFDFALFAKSIGSVKGGLSEEQKEAINKGKKAARDVEALTIKVQGLTDSVRELKKKLEKDGRARRRRARSPATTAASRGTPRPAASPTPTLTFSTPSLPRNSRTRRKPTRRSERVRAERQAGRLQARRRRWCARPSRRAAPPSACTLRGNMRGGDECMFACLLP